MRQYSRSPHTAAPLTGKLNEGSFYWDNYRAKKREEFSTWILNDQRGSGDNSVLTDFFECIKLGLNQQLQ